MSRKAVAAHKIIDAWPETLGHQQDKRSESRVPGTPGLQQSLLHGLRCHRAPALSQPQRTLGQGHGKVLARRHARVGQPACVGCDGLRRSHPPDAHGCLALLSHHAIASELAPGPSAHLPRGTMESHEPQRGVGIKRDAKAAAGENQEIGFR